MSDPPASTPVRTAPMALWRVAQAFLHVLHNLFGAPEDVAFRHTLTRDAHQLLSQWLRCAEAMVRRLIAIEASAYPKPNTRPLLHPRRPRVRKAMSFDDDKPETWRVSFRVFLDRRRPRRQTAVKRHERCRRDAGGPSVPSFRSAWPLAERYEALIRVFNDPAPYARRLAKRLHAAPHRLAEVLRAPPEAVHRIDHFADMGERAACGWPLYRGSG